MYDRSFKYISNPHSAEEADDDRERVPGQFSEAQWEAARNWESQTLVDYLLGRIDTVFYKPWILQRISLLAALTRVNNIRLLKLFLSREEIQKYHLQPADEDTYGPVVMAIENNDTDTLEMLFSMGANLKQKDPGGNTLLHAAAYEVRWEAIGLLLAKGADLWAVNPKGQYPVESAFLACERNPDLERRLLEAMIRSKDQAPDANWKEQLLWSALRLDVLVDISGFIEMLLDIGADVFARNIQGKTALEELEAHAKPLSYKHEVWGDGHPDAHTIAGSFLKVDPYIWPAGHINRQLWEAARGGLVEEYHIILFNLLIRTGRSALEVSGEVGHRGFTALHYLCDSGRSRKSSPSTCDSTLRMIVVMLDYGASISARDDWGQTPLFLAVTRNMDPIVRLLLERRPQDPAANIHRTRGGTSPLLEAASRGNSITIKCLLDAGADVHRANSGGNILLKVVGAGQQNLEAVRLIIGAGLDPSTVDQYEGTALHLAVDRGFSSAVKLLLEAGCSPYLRRPSRSGGPEGETVLRVALFASVNLRIAPFLESRLKALEELLRCCGNEIVKFEDKGNGDLVCEVVRCWGWKFGERRSQLLVEYGATVHEDCEVCIKVPRQ
jgi:ankyrin repeat protein